MIRDNIRAEALVDQVRAEEEMEMLNKLPSVPDNDGHSLHTYYLLDIYITWSDSHYLRGG